MKLFVIYDKVAEESGPVFEAKNSGIAVRKFKEALSGSASAGDFRLLELGSIDHATQQVVAHDIPEDFTPNGGEK